MPRTLKTVSRNPDPSARPESLSVISTLRQEKSLALWLVLLTVVYSFLSCIRQWRFQTGGVDLGVFDQIVWEYSRFQMPSSSFLGLHNALGDHFNPVLALISPLYWIFPGPEILFFLQSFAVTLSAVAVFRFTRRKLGRKPAYFWTVAYTLFWGIQRAMACDFHPDLLALPLTAFAVDFIDSEDWTPAFLCLALLLTVKEDSGILIFFFGVYLMILRRWKPGIICLGLGAAGFYLLALVLVPYLAGSAGYPHWAYTELGSSPGEGLRAALHDPFLVFKVAFSNSEKITTLVCGYMACSLMIFLSPLFVLTLPLYAERMLSNFEHHYSMAYYYSAAIAPIIYMGGVDGLYRLSQFLKSPARARKTILAVSLGTLILNAAVTPIFPLRDLLRVKFYRFKPEEIMGPRVLALIPPEASVMAQDTIAAHLAHRKDIYVAGLNRLNWDCDYFVACKDFYRWPLDGFEPVEAMIQADLAKGYRKIFDEGDWIVLQKGGEVPSPPRN